MFNSFELALSNIETPIFNRLTMCNNNLPEHQILNTEQLMSTQSEISLLNCLSNNALPCLKKEKISIQKKCISISAPYHGMNWKTQTLIIIEVVSLITCCKKPMPSSRISLRMSKECTLPSLIVTNQSHNFLKPTRRCQPRNPVLSNNKLTNDYNYSALQQAVLCAMVATTYFATYLIVRLLCTLY
jgi:hypothetical protein